MPTVPCKPWLISSGEFWQWWDRGTTFDSLAVIIAASVIMLAVASIFVRPLRRTLGHSTPRTLSVTAVAILVLLLLVLAIGLK